MSEEQNVETNDGTWSGLKKTIIGVLTTLVTAGGVWLSSQLFGGHEEAPAQATQQVAPVININNTQQQQQSGGNTTTIIKEKVVEKSAPQETKKAEPKQDELKTKEPQW
ncbi:hypothetical protein CCP3SC1_370002 [Gammaproteobacteria bacterium]|jgi:flagellar basal body-associated protein FliL